MFKPILWFMGLLSAVIWMSLPVQAAEAPAGSPTQAERRELGALKRRLNKAVSQQEMNEASALIGEFWDRLMEAEEQRILAKCDGEEATSFKVAQKLWKLFRDAEAGRLADQFKGGSIRPLLFNTAYTDLTQGRVKQLRRKLSEG